MERKIYSTMQQISATEITYMAPVKHYVQISMAAILQMMDSIFFFMVYKYDDLVYTPIQIIMSPLVARVPRRVCVRSNVYDIFTANAVSYARTALVIPIAVSLKYSLVWLAFWLVILHDFLDHLDGIVAKVQRALYGPVDDPLLGGFMDAFCDKIVNVLALWSLYLVIDPMTFTSWEYFLFVVVCAVVIGYEGTLGVVRVQDFYYAYYKRFYQVETEQDTGTGKETAAVMEGKLKEKLESLGIAFLCLARLSTDGVSVAMPWALYGGICCLLLSVRFAHASLMRKLDARRRHWCTNDACLRLSIAQSPDNQTRCRRLCGSSGSHSKLKEDSIDSVLEDLPSIESTNSNKPSLDIYRRKRRSPNDSGVDAGYEKGNSDSSPSSSASDCSDCSPDGESEAEPNKSPQTARGRLGSSPLLDFKVDKVYTIGCFDLFHWGHQSLLKKMKAAGHQVIVGIHDSRSVYRLKNRVPIDSTEKRMFNVKKYADMVFSIPGTDPTPFIQCMIHFNKGETGIFIRGDDMPKFPSRHLVEKFMAVQLLPYSKGVSSTQLRRDLFEKANSVDDVIDASDEVFG